MFKEIISSLFLSSCVGLCGVAAFSMDQTPSRQYQGNSIHFNTIYNLGSFDTTDDRYIGTNSTYFGYTFNYYVDFTSNDYYPKDRYWIDNETQRFTGAESYYLTNTYFSYAYFSSQNDYGNYTLSCFNSNIEFYVDDFYGNQVVAYPLMQLKRDDNNFFAMWLIDDTINDEQTMVYVYKGNLGVISFLNIDSNWNSAESIGESFDVGTTTIIPFSFNSGFKEVSLYENEYYLNGVMFFIPSSGYDVGRTDGYEQGYIDGQDDGERFGYINGYNDGINEQIKLPTLFLSILDTPIIMIRSLFDFNVLGVSIFALLGSLITILVAVFIIKKLI